jgi:hypothetical protein
MISATLASMTVLTAYQGFNPFQKVNAGPPVEKGPIAAASTRSKIRALRGQYHMREPCNEASFILQNRLRAIGAGAQTSW